MLTFFWLATDMPEYKTQTFHFSHFKVSASERKYVDSEFENVGIDSFHQETNVATLQLYFVPFSRLILWKISVPHKSVHHVYSS